MTWCCLNCGQINQEVMANWKNDKCSSCRVYRDRRIEAPQQAKEAERQT